MGYYSSFTGSIDITPPIPWDKLYDTDFIDDRRNGTFYIEVDEDVAIVSEGELHLRKGVAVKPVTDESIKGYDAEHDLGEIIFTFMNSHTFNGTITVSGEENGDFWRFVVNDNKVTVERATLVWPDGSVAGS